MSKLNINRRQLLKASSALTVSSLLAGCGARQTNQWLVSAMSDNQGNHFAAAVDAHGTLVNKVRLPERGHDALALPTKPGHALIFARRPDRFLLEVDFASGQIVQQINSEPDSHFYGHGALSVDGKYLFTTENAFDQAKGIVVVRDASNYQVLARYESGGVGPHELKLMPNGKQLVIANGGIETHPDTPRVKLNLRTMQPNLAYLEIASGKVIDSYQPQHHQQSLRHLDVDTDGTVYVGVQYQGNKSDLHPLIYGHKGETQLQAFRAPKQQWLSMRQYTASVLVDNIFVTVSCPRANQVTYWDKKSKRFVGKNEFKDVAGLAKLNGQAFASNGFGELMHINSSQAIKPTNHQLRFDNHMTQIQAA